MGKITQPRARILIQLCTYLASLLADVEPATRERSSLQFKWISSARYSSAMNERFICFEIEGFVAKISRNMVNYQPPRSIEILKKS